MPSNKTLDAKNLEALGTERLAELLLEVTAGNAAAKGLSAEAQFALGRHVGLNALKSLSFRSFGTH